MQNLIISVAAGTGVGINSLLSRSLGEKRFDRADKAADNGIFLAILSALVTLVLGFTVVRPFIASQTSDPEILEYGCQYLGIVMTISAGAYFQVTFERLLQSTGLTMYSMVSQLTGAVVNIIMDPIMIFGLLGCPAMGAEQLEEAEYQPMWDDVKGALSGKKIALFGSYGWGDGEWMR